MLGRRADLARRRRLARGCRLHRVTSRRSYWMGSPLPYAVDGAAPWLVNVDGAGPTDRRGAVRFPRESLGVNTARRLVQARSAARPLWRRPAAPAARACVHGLQEGYETSPGFVWGGRGGVGRGSGWGKHRLALLRPARRPAARAVRQGKKPADALRRTRRLAAHRVSSTLRRRVALQYIHWGSLSAAS